MTEFLESITLFPLLLTLGTYQIGVFCQKKTKSALCNPLLIATLLSIGVLLLTDFDLTVYQSGSSWITWLLTKYREESSQHSGRERDNCPVQK